MAAVARNIRGLGDVTPIDTSIDPNYYAAIMNDLGVGGEPTTSAWGPPILDPNWNGDTTKNPYLDNPIMIGGKLVSAPWFSQAAGVASYNAALKESENPWALGGPGFAAAVVMGAAATAFLSPATGAASGAETASAGAEALQPIVVTAAPIAMTPEVAAAAASMGLPTIAEIGGSTLLSFPELAGSAAMADVNALADNIVQAVNTPEMQSAIASGAVPKPPTSLLSSEFKKWAISTGIHAVEQQLGRALTPNEQAEYEKQLAAEIARRQAALAGQGAPGAWDPLVKIGLAAGAAVLLFFAIK